MSAIALGVAAIGAAATITTGIISNNTQKTLNQAKIEQMQNDTITKRLTATERNALDTKTANAKTDTERLKIWEDALSSLGGNVITSTGNIYAVGVSSKSQQNYITNSIVMASGILFVGGTVGLMLKKD
jgi:hypothetical protein